MRTPRVGFACHVKSFEGEDGFKKAYISSLDKMTIEDRINTVKERAIINLERTIRNIKFCIQNDIQIYRLSSDIIPRATYIQEWWSWYEDKHIVSLCDTIKLLTEVSGLRTSFHPDQVVNLGNQFDDSIFTDKSLPILEYHDKLAELCGVDTILIHCGGKYASKGYEIKDIMDQFKSNFDRLPKSIQDKLHVENDKVWNLSETILLAQKCNIPVVADLHHDRCCSSPEPFEFYINAICDTWKDRKWNPKCHLSTGATHELDYAHADYLDQSDYDRFLKSTCGLFDCIIEAKAKELAVLNLRPMKI